MWKVYAGALLLGAFLFAMLLAALFGWVRRSMEHEPAEARAKAALATTIAVQLLMDPALAWALCEAAGWPT